LRYFYEDLPELPVIAAGSLLEFTLSNHSFSMPVGRIEYYYMGPMTFEEFLLAKEESYLLSVLQEYDFQHPFPLSAHQKLSKYLAEYLLVGGMPEAVQLYVETGDIQEVMNIHSSIIETYIDDFAKYARDADLLRLRRIFDYVPTSVGEKTKYSNIDPNEKARELRKAIGLLEKANVIYCVYHSQAAGVPLKAGKNDKVFKMFFLDIGLMNRICRVQNIPVEQLEKKEFVNQGKMAEQFIQQHLLRIERSNEKPEIFYWLREGRTANAEIDFIAQSGSGIVPVEVKAGATGSLKSLHRFVHEKKLKFAIRFDMTPPSLTEVKYKLTADTQNPEVTFKLMSLPLYMVEQLPRYVAH
jgi:predicted AAA+ superfamily ATPase